MLLDVQALENNHIAENQTPYAIAKLGESARVVRQAISELPTLRRRLERNKEVKSKAREIYDDLLNQRNRLFGALNIAALSLMEAEQDEYADHSVKLSQSIKAFNLMTPDYTKLCAVLNNYVTNLPLADPLEEGSLIADEAQTTNKSIIGRLMNNVRMGYYPTSTDNLAHIVRGMDLPEDITVNLFDPCCGCGLALRSVAEGIVNNGSDCKTYGIELDGYRAEEALTRIDRVGFGSFYHSRISNEAFHAMLLNPPYLSVMTEGGNNTRNERLFLVDSINNLMMGGLLIYIIPYYRLTADIARIFCDNFDDISVWKFTSGEFKKFKQIAVIGTRLKRRDGSALAPALASLVLEPANLPELTELPAGRYQLPSIAKEVALFKGALFNETKLAEQLSNSKSFSRLFQRSGLDNISKRPLLPLSLGQIGLVGGSGLINGWVDCDTPHIIKGRIVKEKRLRTEDNNNSRGDRMSTTLTETISNKLIFNLLTPKGFLSLTDYTGIGSIVESDDGWDDDTDSRMGHSYGANRQLGSSSAGSSRLPLGRTVITSDASDVLTENEIHIALRRHESGDWGDVSDDDRKANEAAVKYGERVISVYFSSGDVKFWVITECDRSVTTVLLPDDY